MPKVEVNYSLVSKEFVNKMEKVNLPLNAIAEFTFYRTYSRYDENLKRRENWLEACIRSGEYSVNLGIRTMKKNGSWIEKKHLPLFQKEAEELIENMYHQYAFVSGRTLYTGGSEAAELYPLSNFNCSSAVIDEFVKIGEMFYLLMVGTGFGFRILTTDVEKLPNIRQNLEITHKEYEAKDAPDRLEHTKLELVENEAIMEIGDSKEGWRQSIDTFFKLISKEEYSHISNLTIVYDSVRPKGERLKTFGGTASGHTSIRNMFATIDKIIKDQLDERIAPIENGKLRPIHVMDICNAVAYNVVSGGVRRSAQICLFSPEDHEVLTAKYGLNGLYGHKAQETYNELKILKFPVPELTFEYSDDVVDFNTGEKIPFVPGRYHLEHRRMSNNSAVYFKKPTRAQLHVIVKLLENEGEPGFINAEEALRRFPWFHGMNPCAEILLDDRGLCNLSTVPAINHVKNGKLDKESLFRAARVSARIGVRMTTIDLELPQWDAKQKLHRLTGTSLTGWQDMKSAVKMTDEEEVELLKELREVTKSEAREYAYFLRIPAPFNTTTVKPEGTQSLLAGGVSSGLHAAHAPYYKRRIRISATDPLLKAVEALGWPVENEVGQGVTYVDPKSGEKVTSEVSTKVLTFALNSPSERTKDDLTVEEQFETYFRFQKHYTDQNTSNTITVKPHEWVKVEEILWDRWDEMLAVSFLALDGGTYELAPYEKIEDELDSEGNVVKTAQQIFEEFNESMPAFSQEILQMFDSGEEIDIGSESCEGGACPVR